MRGRYKRAFFCQKAIQRERFTMRGHYKSAKSISRSRAVFVLLRLLPTPTNSRTILPRGDVHKFSRCSINHFIARPASFGLSGLIRYMQSSYTQCYIYMNNSV